MVALVMTPERWARIEELFDRALACDTDAARASLLDTECGGDAALRTEVAKMLASEPLAAGALHAAVAAEASHVASARVAAQVGRRLGPYKLTALLGEGGMGAVYLAERDKFAQQVAIKIVARALGTPQSIARFRDERQILASLVHPNIVRLLDGGSTDEDDLPYLVMERVEGQTIVRYAEERALSVAARVQLVVQICAALQYAHGKLVVHRDIKPSNILVDASGTPKILDFGIAKLLGPGEAFTREAATRTGVAPFTPEYASPEQARGEPVATTTDVYSTGAVLFELLAGRAPLAPTGGPLEMLRTICEVDPPRASSIAPADRRREVAGDLDNIVAKALHKEPARRYASMEQLADDLARYLDGRPVGARTATLAYRTRKFVRRNKGAVTAAFAIAATLVGATVISLRQARRADEQAERADANAANAKTESAHATAEAQRANANADRATKSEAQLQDKLDQLRAETAAREAAQGEAQAAGKEVAQSRDELAAALLKAQAEKKIAEEESARARAAEARAETAATAEKAAREQAEALLAKERAHSKELEEHARQITNKLP